jgi:hypothetical protein
VSCCAAPLQHQHQQRHLRLELNILIARRGEPAEVLLLLLCLFLLLVLLRGTVQVAVQALLNCQDHWVCPSPAPLRDQHPAAAPHPVLRARRPQLLPLLVLLLGWCPGLVLDLLRQAYQLEGTCLPRALPLPGFPVLLPLLLQAGGVLHLQQLLWVPLQQLYL